MNNQNKLKFRVWGKMRKEYIYPDSPGQQHYILTLNGEFYNLQNGSGGDEYIVEQFTGLKDGGGKDIFTGDILSIDDGEYIALVEYCEEFARYQFVVYIDDGEEPKGDLIFNGVDFAEDYTEIIGNINENKELLKS